MSELHDDPDPVVLQGLAQAVPQVDPPAELRARVLASIGGNRTRRDPADRRAITFGFVCWLATAAALALAVGLGVYTVQLRGQIATLESELREANVRADASQRQVADAQRA